MDYRTPFLRDPKFSRFGKIPACDRQTDGWTNRQTNKQTHYDSIIPR